MKVGVWLKPNGIEAKGQGWRGRLMRVSLSLYR